MKFILGRKIEMSQIFQGDKVAPVTIIEAGPCFVTQIKNLDKDGYEAIQIGYGFKKNLKQPQRGHLKNIDKNLRYLREFSEETAAYKVGEEIKVGIFQPGDKVVVSGVSKGRGFAGVIKRHGFKGQSPSHGHKDQMRMPGSIGSTGPQRVLKGTRMAGRMGGERVTVKNLEIIEVNPEKNLLVLKGAVPGARNSLVEIRSL